MEILYGSIATITGGQAQYVYRSIKWSFMIVVGGVGANTKILQPRLLNIRR